MSMMAGGGLTGDAAILSDDVRRFKEESEKEVMEVSPPASNIPQQYP